MIDWQILANGTGFEWVHASLTKEFGFLPVIFKRSEKLTESALIIIIGFRSFCFFVCQEKSRVESFFFWIYNSFELICVISVKKALCAHVCMCVFFKKKK